jgi:hypothetical protein
MPVGRDGDEKWQKKIIEILKLYGANEQHIETLRQDIGSVRFHPQEVTAAATQPPPSDFDTCSPIAERIVEKLCKVN